MSEVVGSFGAVVRAKLLEVLDGAPQLSYHWRQPDVLVIPSTSATGFDIEIVIEDAMVVLNALGWHEHFERGEGGTSEETADEALGMIRDMLSTGMRLRERLAGSRPFRWFLEVHSQDRWEIVSETGLLLFNYFGRRSERIRQNSQMPNRLSGA